MKNTRLVGEQSEAHILTAFLRAGLPVLLPFGGSQPYDLVVDRDGHLERIQCKTGRLQNGTVRFNVSSKHFGNGKRNERRSYHGRVEQIAVYCPENGRVYLVPVDKTGKNVMALRVDKPKGGLSRPSIHWADKYELRC